MRRQISWAGRLTHSTTAAGGTDNDDEEYYNEERERMRWRTMSQPSSPGDLPPHRR